MISLKLEEVLIKILSFCFQILRLFFFVLILKSHFLKKYKKRATQYETNKIKEKQLKFSKKKAVNRTTNLDRKVLGFNINKFVSTWFNYIAIYIVSSYSGLKKVDVKVARYFS